MSTDGMSTFTSTYAYTTEHMSPSVSSYTPRTDDYLASEEYSTSVCGSFASDDTLSVAATSNEETTLDFSPPRPAISRPATKEEMIWQWLFDGRISHHEIPLVATHPPVAYKRRVASDDSVDRDGSAKRRCVQLSISRDGGHSLRSTVRLESESPLTTPPAPPSTPEATSPLKLDSESELKAVIEPELALQALHQQLRTLGPIPPPRSDASFESNLSLDSHLPFSEAGPYAQGLEDLDRAFIMQRPSECPPRDCFCIPTTPVYPIVPA